MPPGAYGARSGSRTAPARGASSRAPGGGRRGGAPSAGPPRQGGRPPAGEPLGARLIAELIEAGGLARVVAVDLHTPSIEGCFAVPLEHLSAVDLLAETIRPGEGREAVIVSPDLGAVKLAERYAVL